MKRGETVSDNSIIERFEEIYDKTYDSIYRYLITKVSPREAAEARSPDNGEKTCSRLLQKLHAHRRY